MAKSKTFSASISFATETSAPTSDQPSNATVINYCNKVIKYLEKHHGIRVPSNYATSLKQAHLKFRNSEFSISSEIIDSVISSCNMWKEFIDIEDYHRLVCAEIISMLEIHTSVISARTFQKDHGINFKKQPSSSFVTIVNNYGKITVYH